MTTFSGKREDVIGYLADPNGRWFQQLSSGSGLPGADLRRADPKAYQELYHLSRGIEQFRFANSDSGDGKTKLRKRDMERLTAIKVSTFEPITIASLGELAAGLAFVKQRKWPDAPAKMARRPSTRIRTRRLPEEQAPLEASAQPVRQDESARRDAAPPAPPADATPVPRPSERAERVSSALAELEKLASQQQASTTGTATIIPFPGNQARRDVPAVPAASSPEPLPPVQSPVAETTDQDLNVFEFLRSAQKRQMFDFGGEPHFSPANLWRGYNDRWVELTSAIQAVKDFSHQNRQQLSLDQPVKEQFIKVVNMEVKSTDKRMSAHDLSTIEQCWHYAYIANLTRRIEVPVNTFDAKSGEASGTDPLFGKVRIHMTGLDDSLTTGQKIQVRTRLMQVVHQAVHGQNFSHNNSPVTDPGVNREAPLGQTVDQVLATIIDAANSGGDFTKSPLALVDLRKTIDPESYKANVLGGRKPTNGHQPK